MTQVTSARAICVSLLTLLPLAALAQTTAASFRSGGVEIPAFLQRAEGTDLRAVVINLHGNPGNKIRAESPLATALAKQGVATFWFNYRGIWGNPGTYTLSNSISDARSAIDFLKSPEGKQRLGLTDAPIVLLGHSMGSAVALVQASENDSVAGVVALAPCDQSWFAREMGNPQSRIRPFLEAAREGIFGPNGPAPGGGSAFSEDYLANQQRFSFPGKASALQTRALLFLPALGDTTCAVEAHFLPLYRELRESKHPRLDAFGLNSDHGLDRASAGTFIQVTVDWIVRSFPSSPGKEAAGASSTKSSEPARR